LGACPQIILSFDTALGECSVALWKDGKIAAAKYETERNRQTSQLVPMIEAVMQESGVGFTDLSHIVTTSGPGSFTGIRIGLSVARGFTLACGVPSLAVSTLELLAWQATAIEKEKPIAIAINAYRGEVYVQSFAYHGTLKPLCEAQAIPAEEWDNAFPAATYHRVTDTTHRPDAAALAEYVAHHSLSAAHYPPTPFYIRAPDAKIQTPLLAS
jgi:tRNA threonylcarbamoyl adenosine modification protein YeaZ